MLGRPSRQRCNIRGSGGGASLVVNAIARWIILWIVFIQSFSWRLNNNNNNTDASTTSLLLVEGATFFGIFSSSATKTPTAKAARTTEMVTKRDDEDGNTAVEVLQHQHAAQTEEEADDHPSPLAADDDGVNDNNNTSAARSNSVGNSNDDEEDSWFHDMEFEEYNTAAATLAVETSSTPGVVSTTLDDGQLHPMLQIPLAVSLNDHNNSIKNRPIRAIRAYCDSGATRTVMSYESARRLGWTTHLDRRYAGQATSVGGSCRVLGRLPAGLLTFHLHYIINNNSNDNSNKRDDDNNDTRRRRITVQSPTITVLEDLPSTTTTSCIDDHDDDGNGGFELLLGLDFLREYQAILDLRQEELRLVVKRKEYAIPFLRPRKSTGSSLSCDAPDVATSTTKNEHRWREFGRRGGRSAFDDDDNDDDDYEDFDQTALDMSGV